VPQHVIPERPLRPVMGLATSHSSITSSISGSLLVLAPIRCQLSHQLLFGLQQDKVQGQTDLHPHQPRKQPRSPLEAFLKAISPESEVWAMLSSLSAPVRGVLSIYGCQAITWHPFACDVHPTSTKYLLLQLLSRPGRSVLQQRLADATCRCYRETGRTGFG
jgi:hypothetical protein